MRGYFGSVRIKEHIPPYLALVPVCAGVFIAADDQTVVVTVLPQIMLDMKVQVTELDRASWTITGYLLGYLAAMPLIGRVSDAWGHRRLFILSLAAFMAGSVAVALTPSLTWLVAARIFQAVGAGALVPISIAIVGDLFPPGRRGVPLGLIGGSVEAGGVIGPLWGGLIIRALDWRWVFWINVPLGAAVIVALVLLVGPSPRFRATVDYLGGALLALCLATLTMGLARIGAPDLSMLGYLVSSAGALALFVIRQGTFREPLLSPSMFKARALRAANVTHVLVGGALIIAMVTIPLMTNTAMAMTPLEGGMRLMRLTAAMALGAVLGGFACQRFDPRAPALLGLALAALGFLFMSRWDIAIADPALSAHLVMAGLGFGLLIAPIALAATDSVGEESRGAAAATVSASRMLGMTVGLATLTAWGTDRFQGLVAGISLPFALQGETAAQAEQRLMTFDTQLKDAGMTLFSEFFVIAMVVCLIAMLPVVFMTWRRRHVDL